MSTPENQELYQYIVRLIDETRSGKIEWKQVNPSTFVWDTRDPAGAPTRISLQQLDQQTVDARSARATITTVRSHVFTVIQPGKGDLLSVKGTDDSLIRESLQTLFTTITSGISRRGLDVLGSLLTSPKK